MVTVTRCDPNTNGIEFYEIDSVYKHSTAFVVGDGIIHIIPMHFTWLFTFNHSAI